jgi:4-amino-4-deoxy-L-arabinose transferase-like glycosyltransferase
VRELLRKHAGFFVLVTAAGLALRLLFALRFPAVVDDSRLYADIAKNWLQHGTYGISNSGRIVPTLSRLPGYPAFLAAVFAVFGVDNFRAVLLVQVLVDLGTCLLIADLTSRLLEDRAAKVAFLLAALCPFLANYAGAALTETLEIFFTALALDLAVIALRIDGQRSTQLERTPLFMWFFCGLAVGGAILLRPDGGILLAALGGYLFLRWLRSATSLQATRDFVPLFRAMVLLALGAILPLVPWAIRNLHTLHRFEPLAPRYANDNDELVMTGFNRWVKTWMADFVSVQEIYWNVPDDEIDASKLPRRAFDSPQQKRDTEALFADYNRDHEITRELDARFAALAEARIKADPLRYYLWLPTLRILDMWLRPRTELTAADPRWWEFNDERSLIAVSVGFGLINLLYLVLATGGLIRTIHNDLFPAGLFVVFVLLRSAFLGTLENPEPRYTLECFPVVILLAAALFARRDNLPKLERVV